MAIGFLQFQSNENVYETEGISKNSSTQMATPDQTESEANGFENMLPNGDVEQTLPVAINPDPSLFGAVAGNFFRQPADPMIERNIADDLLQDSANNNVDENSNDGGYQQYAEYHDRFSLANQIATTATPILVPHQLPRVSSDEPDRQALPNLGARPRVIHRRNFSADTTLTDLHHGCSLYNESSAPSSSSLRITVEAESDVPPLWLPIRPPLSPFLRMVAPTPTLDDTRMEARDLLLNFTLDEFQRENLVEAENLPVIRRGLHTENVCSRFMNANYERAGRELRQLADAFAQTEERRRVRQMAESVDMSCIGMEDFFHLCEELFRDGITRERLVALFTFIADVAVCQVRLKAQAFLETVFKWSLEFVYHKLCLWVQERGGWGAVLSQSANIILNSALFVFCVLTSVAAGIYIWKSWRGT